jgi:hypothetical protein
MTSTRLPQPEHVCVSFEFGVDFEMLVLFVTAVVLAIEFEVRFSDDGDGDRRAETGLALATDMTASAPTAVFLILRALRLWLFFSFFVFLPSRLLPAVSPFFGAMVRGEMLCDFFRLAVAVLAF